MMKRSYHKAPFHGSSPQVFIEPEDKATLESILGVADLCLTLRLRPVLRLESFEASVQPF